MRFPSNPLVRAMCIGTFTLAAAACADHRPTESLHASLQPGSVHDGVTVAWNQIARELVTRNVPNQQAALRLFAYLTLAQHKAISAAGNAGTAAVQGAIAGASAEVMSYVFPAETAFLDAQVAAAHAVSRAAARASFEVGETTGRQIGRDIVALARTDNFDAGLGDAPPAGEQYWRSSLEPPRPPLLPLLGRMRPFFLTSGDQFRPAAPPAVGSPELNAALAEVRQISDTRTPEQIAIAKYWAGTTGSLVAGFWNEQATDLIARYRLDERRAAHALSLMHMAVMDANIACHDAKYAYWLPRPTQLDPGITLVVGLPNHPSFPSNHACVSGTAANILSGLFPAERERLQRMSQDAGLSRVYAGIHFRFDADAGYQIADRVSELAQVLDVKGGRPSRTATR